VKTASFSNFAKCRPDIRQVVSNNGMTEGKVMFR
jgi:hypothetical protein